MANFKTQYYRLKFIDEKIREHSFPNCNTIADEFGEVSSRTINRDIEYMKYQLDAPIEYNRSKFGYYYSDPAYKFSSLYIQESELFAICIAEKALEQYANTPLYDTLKSVFDKIIDILPEKITIKASWIDAKFSFLKESFTLINTEVWDTLANSLKEQIRLAILYQAPGYDNPVERIVEPYHITNYKGEWYLIAFCTYRKSILKFAISRIISPTITEEKYDIPDDFNFDKYMGDSFGIITEDREYTVKILFSVSQAPFIKERVWHANQNIKENRDGSIILSFNTNSLFEIKRWALSFGPDAVVLKPKQLVDEIKNDLRKSILNYKY